MLRMKVRNRVFLDRFRCIDSYSMLTIRGKYWLSGNILYYYKDRFNIGTISNEDIIFSYEFQKGRFNYGK